MNIMEASQIQGLSLKDSPPEYTSPGSAQSRAVSTQHQKILASKQAPQCSAPSMAASKHKQHTYTPLGPEETFSSPIHLRINASIRVCNSDNLVCLDRSPADHANAIAKAVVQAIEEHSSGQCGIPMIDEDGRPRPISIDVDAGLTVEGKGNVIGGRSIVSNALAQRQNRFGWGLERDEELEDEPPAKRRKSSVA